MQIGFSSYSVILMFPLFVLEELDTRAIPGSAMFSLMCSHSDLWPLLLI